MSVWGTIIGGVGGFAVGGPLGALLGGVAGHMVDKMRAEQAAIADDGPGDSPDATKRVGFTIAVIALGAKLAKADGVVTRDEIAAFREVFRVPPDEVGNVANVFDRARRSTHGYQSYARQVAGMFADNPMVLEELMGCLFHIATADGKFTDDELAYLENVARIFGFSDADFLRLRAEFVGPDAADPYQILGLAHDADEAEIKRVYRALVRENHPDTLIAQGLPEEFVAVANEKLAAINAAYDRIAKSRGFN